LEDFRLKPITSILYDIEKRQQAVSYWESQCNVAKYHIENNEKEIKALTQRLKGKKCTCGHGALKHLGRYGCQHKYPPGTKTDFQDYQGYCSCVEFDLGADREQKA
jgi:hypothetical protein